ncbi:MAG: M12 family metallo-peptidase, partial [Myxococcota bacterium]
MARRVRAETQADGFYWQGRLHESWPVMITAHRGAISGLIHTPWAQYELVPAGGTTASVPRLAKLEAELFPPCATDAADGSALLSGPPAHRSSTTALAGSAPIILDVLVVYTAQARAGAGGQAQIEATILSAVNVTNTAYANSDVDARLHLMHMAEAPFGDSGSSSTDLSSVRTSTVVQAWRDRFGADLVALIVNGNDACGRGYLQRVPGPGFASLAYQVTTRGCAVGNLSFAHEFGHNQGCEHDPANANPPNRASFPYAYGHFHSGVYRTVMSYSNQCRGGCGRAPYFSNSNVIHEGLDTGIFDARENYRVINQTAGIVAAFRSSASTADFAQSSWTIAEDRGAIDIDVERGGLTDGPATIFVRPREDSARAGADFPV